MGFICLHLSHVLTSGTGAGSGRIWSTQTTWTDNGHGLVSQGKSLPKSIRESWQAKGILSLLRCSSQPYYLTLKRLNTRKPHNSAMVGTVMLPEYRNTRKFKTDTSDSSSVRNRASGTFGTLPRDVTTVRCLLSVEFKACAVFFYCHSFVPKG